MDFLKILRSFEEFVFEAVTWLLFYPMTLWRTVRRPLTTMAYSDREQAKTGDARYDDALSPPLLLLFTIVIGNGLAIAAHIPPPPGSSELTKALYSSPEHLVIFRSMVFSLAPLISAACLVHRRGIALTRTTLRPPFYAQCYLAAPCAAAVAVGGIFLQRPDFANLAGWATILAGAAWFLLVQTQWFRKELNISWLNAALTALWTLGLSLLCLLVVLLPVALL